MADVCLFICVWRKQILLKTEFYLCCSPRHLANWFQLDHTGYAAIENVNTIDKRRSKTLINIILIATTAVRELNGTSQISLVTHDAKGEMREI